MFKRTLKKKLSFLVMTLTSLENDSRLGVELLGISYQNYLIFRNLKNID